MRKYSELIKEEKDNPQRVFNKTHKCSKCGHCEYERWEKVEEGEYEDDGRENCLPTVAEHEKYFPNGNVFNNKQHD